MTRNQKLVYEPFSQLPQTQITQSRTLCLNKIKTGNKFVHFHRNSESAFSVNYDKYSLFSTKKLQ